MGSPFVMPAINSKVSISSLGVETSLEVCLRTESPLKHGTCDNPSLWRSHQGGKVLTTLDTA